MSRAGPWAQAGSAHEQSDSSPECIDSVVVGPRLDKASPHKDNNPRTRRPGALRLTIADYGLKLARLMSKETQAWNV